jgi:hypothetical protein
MVILKKEVMWAFLFQWDAQSFEHIGNKKEQQKNCTHPHPPPKKKNFMSVEPFH